VGRRVRRGRLRWVLLGAAALAALGVAALIAGAPALIRHVLETQLTAALGVPVRMRRVVLDMQRRSVTLQDVAVDGDGDGGGDGTPLASVREATFLLEVGASFQARALIVREVRIDGLRGHLVRLSPSRTNLTPIMRHLNAPSDSPPLAFSISNLQLRDGRIVFDDRVEKRKHVIDDLRGDLPHLGNAGQPAPAIVTPNLRMKIDGAGVAVTGTARGAGPARELAVDLRLDKVDLDDFVPYVPVAALQAIRRGRLKADLHATFDRADALKTLRLRGQVSLRDLELDVGHGAPLASLERLDADITRIDLRARRIELARLDVRRPYARLDRDAAGRLLGWDQLTGGAPDDRAAPPRAGHDGRARPMRAHVAALSITDAAIDVADHAPGGFRETLRGCDVHGRDLTTDASRPLSLAVSCTVGTGGTVSADAAGTIDPLRVDGAVRVQRLDVAPLAAAARGWLGRARIAATVDVAGHVTVGGTLDQPSLSIDGLGAGVADLRWIDGATGRPRLRARRLSLDHARVQLDRPTARGAALIATGDLAGEAVDLFDGSAANGRPLHVGALTASRVRLAPGGAAPPLSVEELRLGDVSVGLVRDERGRISVTGLMSPDDDRRGAPPPPRAANGAPDPAPPLPWVVRTTLERGRLDFVDRYETPSINAVLADIRGRLDLGRASGGAPTAKLTLYGRVKGGGELALAGNARRLTRPRWVGARLRVSGVELPPLSPYLVRLMGRRAKRGVATADLSYLLDHRRLTGDNRIHVKGLQLGPPESAPHITFRPFLMAVNVLARGADSFDLDIPVNGDLDDPHFQIGPALMSAFTTSLVKAVLSPLRWIGL
jgi:hypothetical protein